MQHMPQAQMPHMPQMASIPRTGDSLYQRMFGDFESSFSSVIVIVAIVIVISWAYERIIKPNLPSKSSSGKKSKKQTSQPKNQRVPAALQNKSAKKKKDKKSE